MPARHLSALGVIARVITLTIILFLCFVVAGRVIGGQGTSGTTEGAGATAGILLAVCFLDASVLAYVILRSRWAGWRLMAAVFVVFYGVATFMGQIESAVFITRLPPGMLPRLFLMGALIAAPFSALAVLILGKARADGADASESSLMMPPREWAWKLAVIILAYVVLYFTFGYFIAWQNPAVREYYDGIDEGSFLAHMRSVLTNTPSLVPIQIIRAILWVLIALPVIRMMKGRWQETALALALLFAVVMNAQLLLPNPYMPEAVRMTHLVETASSNFLLGLLVGGMLRPKPARPSSGR